MGKEGIINKALGKNANRYAGKFCCVARRGSKVIISADDNMKIAIRAAKQKGCKNPVVFYNPGPGEKLMFMLSPKELEKMVQQSNLPRVLSEVSPETLAKMEAFRRARAKSKGSASKTVFI